MATGAGVRAGIGFASSHADDPFEAMADLVDQLGTEPLAGAVIFCSQHYDRDSLARAMIMTA